MLKFPADGGIVTIRSTILILSECATVITSPKEIPKEARTSHQNLKVTIHPNFPDQEVAIGGTLSLAGRMELCTLLKKNLDIFAWQPSNMTRVPRSIAEHRLNIRKGYSPVRQKKRGQTSERAKAIQAEMAESDEEKMAFHTSQRVYCYTKMPFGLKKAGATYQRLVDKAFHSQVGRNMEVYVDDLVIKSHTEAEMLRDIDETYTITPEGIKPCPDKTEAVLQLSSPRKIKEAHRTMIKSSHGDTPFSLTYGTEAVIPAEIGMPTYRTATVDTIHNNEELRLNLDLLEEKRERAAICEAKSKMKMTKYYNARFRGVAFRPRDFVYRSNDASHAAAGGKLGPR
ncbi:hypothetical protein Tco_0574280 [Tanacetum coccineum]